MRDTPNTTNSDENDAEKLASLLEAALMQKRAAWKHAAAHYRTIRMFGFLFLFILIVTCAGGFFFVFSRVSPEQTNQRTGSTPTLTKP